MSDKSTSTWTGSWEPIYRVGMVIGWRWVARKPALDKQWQQHLLRAFSPYGIGGCKT